MQKLNHCLFYDEKNKLPGFCGCRYKIQATKIKFILWQQKCAEGYSVFNFHGFSL